MARAPVMAAGGIVLRQARPPLIAVVRLRKRNEWVLPKGKLDDGETPRDAAEREVNEETGHDVTVHEFLGTLVYESGGRSKVVHYWRMEACGGQAYELMSDVREVDWLPLEAAIERLSRAYERAFLENVGPLALEAAVAELSRRKAKPEAARKRRSRPVVPQPPPAEPEPAQWTAELPPAGAEMVVVAESKAEMAEPVAEAAPVVDPPDPVPDPAASDPAPIAAAPEPADIGATGASQNQGKSLAALLRKWLRRAA